MNGKLISPQFQDAQPHTQSQRHQVSISPSHSTCTFFESLASLLQAHNHEIQSKDAIIHAQTLRIEALSSKQAELKLKVKEMNKKHMSIESELNTLKIQFKSRISRPPIPISPNPHTPHIGRETLNRRGDKNAGRHTRGLRPSKPVIRTQSPTPSHPVSQSPPLSDSMDLQGWAKK
eukprot:gnl/Dysnectes_brevis/1668_a1898_2340.p1 GENE.gnl/Dysnectes_brevis/1668_a1898_2340~~gnl/Dysnectes_brevis/1668_a1898_2340.p1  ORF type:complete len:176 (+),score=7.09 gnl/Dysnectes_brevis/1668_a1898_2340:58-585(+)